ncbi:site-2 protease family protein [Scatolibacter rhodanostii]|uniref:site-2 protease family protein n=1 Tax=Scatolibacter rhodanostii TaxID=2014781 RepID=UPI001FA8D880|nr:site-2 protease family protein [Scatolibacter rhodanostii]
MLINALRTVFSGGHVDISQLIAYILSVLFIIFLILPLHEYAHGWTAYKLGDPTAKLDGRLTLNPLASLDIQGAFWLMFFGFGWAKPVPVDPRYFKKPKRDMAITALAGPLSNVIAGFVGALIYCALLAFMPANILNGTIMSFVMSFIWFYISVNISLAVFNLLPIPPLDGSKILAAFLPNRIMYSFQRYQNMIMMALFFLMITGAFSGPLGVAQTFLTRLILNLAAAPFSLLGKL